MSEVRKFAVILVRHDLNQPIPTMEECKKLFVKSRYSIVNYWQENSDRWLDLSTFDFYGPFDVMLPTPPDARGNLANLSFTAANIDRSRYDGFIIMLYPGNVYIDNPKHAGDAAQPEKILKGFDAGADGEGPGHMATLVAFESRTFMCHELGHLFGFDHTYGIMNTGADWSDDNVAQYYPVYGDPYDLMSSASFGGASPTFTIDDNTESLTDYPNALSAGPMLSRAHLHFVKPMALELKGRVSHFMQAGNNEVETLYPAGTGEDGKKELIVYHPNNEDDKGRGRIYIEYRQYFGFAQGTRWDKGLKDEGDDKARSGVIIHTVKNIAADSSIPAVWYVSRIVFPSVDSDVDVTTDLGVYTVQVNQDSILDNKPAYVRIRVSPKIYANNVSIQKNECNDVVTILSSEKRKIPGWDFAGEFTWERRGYTRTCQYVPIVTGFGGEGSFDKADVVNVRWFIGANMCVDDNGIINVLPDGGNLPVNVHYTIDPQTKVLEIYNVNQDEGYSVKIQLEAYSNNIDKSAWSTYTAPPIETGWGNDYQRFMDFLNHLNNPVPKKKFGIPHHGDPVNMSDLQSRITEMKNLNPQVAQQMLHIFNEAKRTSFSNYQQGYR